MNCGSCATDDLWELWDESRLYIMTAGDSSSEVPDIGAHDVRTAQPGKSHNLFSGALVSARCWYLKNSHSYVCCILRPQLRQHIKESQDENGNCDPEPVRTAA